MNDPYIAVDPRMLQNVAPGVMTSREPLVTVSCKELERSITALRSRVEELEAKLVPVLRTGNAQLSAPSKPHEELSAPLAEWIAVSSHQISMVCDRVSMLIERLEI